MHVPYDLISSPNPKDSLCDWLRIAICSAHLLPLDVTCIAILRISALKRPALNTAIRAVIKSFLYMTTITTEPSQIEPLLKIVRNNCQVDRK
jgi:hypothetical protein